MLLGLWLWHRDFALASYPSVQFVLPLLAPAPVWPFFQQRLDELQWGAIDRQCNQVAQAQYLVLEVLLTAVATTVGHLVKS